MTFDEVKKCIIDFKVLNLKVTDTQGKKLMEFINELSPESLNMKLDGYLGTLQTYGAVKFIAANETQYKQNWKDCYNWHVTFTGISHNATLMQQHTPTHQIGFVSSNEATLMAQVKVMEMQMEFNKKMMELEQKLNTPKEHHYERLADKYGPLLMAMAGVKLDPDQVQQMMGWYQLQNAMNGKNPMVQQNNNNPGIAGIKQEPVLQQTKEEQELELKIVNEMNALRETLSDDKILKLVTALKMNPGVADTLLGMIKT